MLKDELVKSVTCNWDLSVESDSFEPSFTSGEELFGKIPGHEGYSLFL